MQRMNPFFLLYFLAMVRWQAQDECSRYTFYFSLDSFCYTQIARERKREEVEREREEMKWNEMHKIGSCHSQNKNWKGHWNLLKWRQLQPNRKLKHATNTDDNVVLGFLYHGFVLMTFITLLFCWWCRSVLLSPSTDSCDGFFPLSSSNGIATKALGFLLLLSLVAILSVPQCY